MGSYSPPPPAAEAPTLKQFIFEQADEEIITELSANPKVFKTLTISNIPTDAAGNANDVVLFTRITQAIARVEAGGQSGRFGLRLSNGSSDTNTLDPFIDATTFTKERADAVTSINPPVGTNITIKVIAFVSSASHVIHIKNMKIIVNVFIPTGATVVES